MRTAWHLIMPWRKGVPFPKKPVEFLCIRTYNYEERKRRKEEFEVTDGD
jgi:hypothetical protein